MNKQQRKKYNTEYYIKNKEVMLIQKKQYYEDNIEKILEWKKQYFLKNIDKIRKYNKEHSREIYQKNRKWVNEYKLYIGCLVCGYNKCAEALDFHHLNDDDKSFNISTKVGKNTNLEIIKKEMEKCIILCRNCHAELHEKNRKEKRDSK